MQAHSQRGVKVVGRSPPQHYKVTFPPSVGALTSWISSIYEIDSSFDHKVTSLVTKLYYCDNIEWGACQFGIWTWNANMGCSPLTAVKFHNQQTSHMEPSATSTMVTGPVWERLQVGTEDAPVLDCPVPLRRLHDYGARYNIQTYLHHRSHEMVHVHQPQLVLSKSGWS